MKNMFSSFWHRLFMPNENTHTQNTHTKAFYNDALVALSPLGEARWTPRNYAAFADEGFRQNVIVHRCVNEIARSIALVPLGLHRKNVQKKVEEVFLDHPLLSLLKRPNPLQGGAAFIESLISSWLISGNAYLEVITDDAGIPKELHVLRPDRMKVIPGNHGLPQGYVYTIEDQVIKYAADPISGQSNILHLKLYHPLDDWYGMSPIEAAAFSIDQHNAAGAHNQALLQNGARPMGALIYRPKSGSVMTEGQRESLKNQVESNYVGAKNAGKVLVLEGDFEWREMGLRPRDMDFIAAKNTAARDIAQAFGMPPVLIGIPGDATYSNLVEARIALWEQTIIPLLDHMNDALNNWLVPRFLKDIELTYDLDQVPALAPRRQMVWDKIRQADFLTVNEKRQALGYPPLNDKLMDKFVLKSPHSGAHVP
ncbi:MAG: phage portal protein [Alphaproteobacteria bacterium]|nr:phage portal protein [Alphaproteobacteria bacterium]